MAKLTIEMDLGDYQDTLDKSLYLYRVEEDVADAFRRTNLLGGALAAKVEIRHYDKRVGTLTIDLEAT